MKENKNKITNEVRLVFYSQSDIKPFLESIAKYKKVLFDNDSRESTISVNKERKFIVINESKKAITPGIKL